PMDYIRRHLGKELCGLLDLIEGGTAGDERLRAIAAIAIDAELLVADEDERAVLLGLVPGPKQAELAQRLGSLGDEQPLHYLHTLKWTPDERRELLEFLGFTVERAQPQVPAYKRETAPDYALFPHQLRAA